MGMAGGWISSGVAGMVSDGGRLAGEDGDGVFVLRAGHGRVNQLRARAFQLRAGLLDVELRGHALIETVHCELELFLIVPDGAFQQRVGGVAAAQFEVIGGEFGLRAEAGSLQIGGAGLRREGVGRNLIADASPGVGFVRELEGDLEVANTPGRARRRRRWLFPWLFRRWSSSCFR